MKKIVVLGCGRVGSAIAKDLHQEKEFDVVALDISEKNLSALKESGIKTKNCDFTKTKEVEESVKEVDLVIDAVPGFMGFETLKNIISFKKNVVDISFFPEDPFELDDFAKMNEVTAIVDAGVAPGCSNLIAGRMDSIFDTFDNFICYVGGLPLERYYPYEYKAPFSPIDVIEEYTRKARIVKDGKMVEMEALSESEYLNFKGIGTLEAFNTDGLRTLLKTVKAKNMVEKTLRYIGHIEKMKLLKETNFFSKEKIKIGEALVSPLEMTTKLLFPLWSFGEEEEDLTVMKIVASGEINKKVVKYTYDLFDKMDTKKGVSSMARTTGYTATSCARLFLEGNFREKGIIPLEYIGRNYENYLFIMKELAKRGVIFKESVN